MNRLATANTDFARRGDKDYLRHLIAPPDNRVPAPGIVTTQESKDTILSNALIPGWRSLQHGTADLDRAKMGAAICYNTHVYDLIDEYLTLGCTPWWLGRRLGLLTRYIAVAVLEDKTSGRHLTAISPHLPPLRFRVLAPGYKKRLRAEVERHRYWIIGTDANEPLVDLARFLHGACRGPGNGQGIVGIISNMVLTETRVIRWGQAAGVTDHPAVASSAAWPAHAEA